MHYTAVVVVLCAKMDAKNALFAEQQGVGTFRTFSLFLAKKYQEFSALLETDFN